jgi:acetyl-CoA carboxylase biotin carboxyl carrier protein
LIGATTGRGFVKVINHRDIIQRKTMNVSSASTQDIFDVRKIRRLVELMKEHDLCEIDLQQGDVRIQLRRATAAAMPAMVALPAAPALQPIGPPAPESHVPTATEPKGGSGTVIKSPMVGTFYSASSPDVPPYVKVGDHVGPETTVCIVEAMKVFNQIPAELSGRIVAVLAENGAPVEFGQPLFKITTGE